MYLHHLGRLSHHNACTSDRCVRSCDVAGFLADLAAPLFPADVARREQEQERLVALAKGELILGEAV